MSLLEQGSCAVRCWTGKKTYGATVTSLGDERQVGRESTGVTRAGSLLVVVRAREVVRELAGALEHLSLVVRAVLVLDLLGHRLDLGDAVRDTDQVAPRDAVERVAGRAHLAVDLGTTADTVDRGPYIDAGGEAAIGERAREGEERARR